MRAWDKQGYSASGGLLNPSIARLMTMRSAAIAAQTSHNYPAPIAILDCIFEGTMMPFDQALRLESKYFAKLLCDPVSRNLIRTTFVNKAEVGKLARRPKQVPKLQVRKLGVLGAGMMGSGIAYVSAAAGVDVVLLDTELPLAQRARRTRPHCWRSRFSEASEPRCRPTRFWRISFRLPTSLPWRVASSLSKRYSRMRGSRLM